jgi:hypothetical protein
MNDDGARDDRRRQAAAAPEAAKAHRQTGTIASNMAVGTSITATPNSSLTTNSLTANIFGK